MPYEQYIGRTCKGLFGFLIDQSHWMNQSGARSGTQFRQAAVDAVNSWLYSLCVISSREAGVEDWFDVFVLGYRTTGSGQTVVESALGGKFKRGELWSIADIAKSPLRLDTRTQFYYDEDSGDEAKRDVVIPVWYTPMAIGRAPLCSALQRAFGIVKSWIGEHPSSFPPVVSLISSGENTDHGDPILCAEMLKELSTSDGNVLLLTTYLSATQEDAFIFPVSRDLYSDERAIMLFDIASILPDKLRQHAISDGWELAPGTKAMESNSAGQLGGLLKWLSRNRA